MTAAELEALARGLGGAERQGRGWSCFCPAHDNTKTPALSIDIGRNGNVLVKCHAGCDGLAVLDAMRGRGLISGQSTGAGVAVDPMEAKERARREAAMVADRRAKAVGLWIASHPAQGTIVETYLVESRGIPLKVIPTVLRFHPSVRHPAGGNHPAMMALVTNLNGNGIGVHRTYLKPDGSGKADLEPSKAMLGPCAGGCVRFSSDAPKMAASEGIENALSFAVETRIPTVATLSTSGMKGFIIPPLPLAAQFIVAADSDDAGRAAAAVLIERARAQGRKSAGAYPPDGLDYNKFLQLQNAGQVVTT